MENISEKTKKPKPKWENLYEGVRRYQNPFDMEEKRNAYRNLKSEKLSPSAKYLVLMDSHLSSSAELIFGLKPGDTVSVSLNLSFFRNEYIHQIEYLLEVFKPQAMILAVSKSFQMPNLIYQKFQMDLMKKINLVKPKKSTSPMEIKICVVDEYKHQINFLNLMRGEI